MVLAVVPARGGSKGVKNKNLRRIGDKSLVKIACDYALSEHEISQTIVSTDSNEVAREFASDEITEEFASLAQGKILLTEYGVYLHKRKAEHAGDYSSTIELVLDILSDKNLAEFESLLLLQPTSPFRKPGEVKKVIEAMTLTSTNSCVSAKLFNSPHPQKSFTLDPDGILEADKFQLLSVPRQKLQNMYVFDGAFYLSKIESICRNESLLAPRTSIYLREGVKTLNIDNEEDMKIAVAVAKDLLFHSGN